MSNTSSLFRPESFQLVQRYGELKPRDHVLIRWSQLLIVLVIGIIALLALVQYAPIKRFTGQVTTVPSPISITMPHQAYLIEWAVNDGQSVSQGQPIAKIAWQQSLNQPELHRARAELIDLQIDNQKQSITIEKKRIEHALSQLQRHQDNLLKRKDSLSQLIKESTALSKRLTKRKASIDLLVEAKQLSVAAAEQAQVQQIEAMQQLSLLLQQKTQLTEQHRKADEEYQLLVQQLALIKAKGEQELAMLELDSNSNRLSASHWLRAPIGGRVYLYKSSVQPAAGRAIALITPIGAELAFETRIGDADDLELIKRGASVQLNHLPWLYHGAFNVDLHQSDTTALDSAQGFRALFTFTGVPPDPIAIGDQGVVSLQDKSMSLGSYLLLPKGMTGHGE